MAKPTRYTTRAIVTGDVDLLGCEVRRANRMPGQHGWYREVIFRQVGARWVATGRPVLDGGDAPASHIGVPLGERVEFSEGPAHQTYEVREVEITPVYRQAVRDARDVVRHAIACGTRIAIDPTTVDELFWGELEALIRLIVADDELRAAAEQTDRNGDAEPPADPALDWRAGRASKGGGHYVATHAGITYDVRRDAQASEVNRWALYRAGVRISAHRLLNTAKRAATRDLHAQLATRAAAAKVAADQPDSTEQMLLDTVNAVARIVDVLVVGATVTRNPAGTWMVNGHHDRDRYAVDRVAVDAALRLGVVASYAMGTEVRLTSWRPSTVVTITPRAERQFEIIAPMERHDDLVRVAPVRARCEHDGPRWVSRSHVRPVPPEVPVDRLPVDADDPQYDYTCPGHPARPAGDDDPEPTLHGKCWHGTDVVLRARPAGWWHSGSGTACDDTSPFIPRGDNTAALADDEQVMPLVDAGGFLRCGCHGSQREHSCQDADERPEQEE